MREASYYSGLLTLRIYPAEHGDKINLFHKKPQYTYNKEEGNEKKCKS